MFNELNKLLCGKTRLLYTCVFCLIVFSILTTGPKGLIYNYESENGTTRERGEFSVSDMSFKGVHLACGQTYTADG